MPKAASDGARPGAPGYQPASIASPNAGGRHFRDFKLRSYHTSAGAQPVSGEQTTAGCEEAGSFHPIPSTGRSVDGITIARPRCARTRFACAEIG